MAMHRPSSVSPLLGSLVPGLLLIAGCADAGAPNPTGTAMRWTPPAIASDQYESSPTFSPDGRELYFMRSDRQFGNWRILHSRCGRDGWSTPQTPSFAAASGADADPFLSADGRRLYFVSTRHDPAGEDLDIYYVERGADGAWGTAQRLPEPVNSKASELLPRATADGRLYFGSSRAGGHGKNDLYLATPQADGGWRAHNLGAPLSTAADEYEADIARDGRSLVAVIDRGGRSHLYRFERGEDGWRESGRIAARGDVFQVGPLLSPRGDRLLFAQADGERSGELFLIDLVARPDLSWPPRCPPAQATR
ncbi:WD40-like Beta Propeller Repeat family protein [Lysobacter antibioticus]|uniref:PD40 domain-containing protein n=1 Tax=Lysobacter antibioticus TaxID=84531 RepID=UPI000721AB29|nr:PD40 domain-containing protein [Lysobacter antibioticus]ALN62443.1 WD40-like Beta Propeller Repeat family protein [Lysobacter antibioticus]